MAPLENGARESRVHLNDFKGEAPPERVAEDPVCSLHRVPACPVARHVAEQHIVLSHSCHALGGHCIVAIGRRCEVCDVHRPPVARVVDVACFNLPVLDELGKKLLKRTFLGRSCSAIEVGLVHDRVIWPAEPPLRASTGCVVTNYLPVAFSCRCRRQPHAPRAIVRRLRPQLPDCHVLVEIMCGLSGPRRLIGRLSGFRLNHPRNIARRQRLSRLARHQVALTAFSSRPTVLVSLQPASL
mmetsp:Transcript_57607/g.160471  ORF Transcript_57607/g.160471 Transcript_57607/m.160471 type:complete len:241 (+) Transcript_57607:384-1106(+)